LKGITRNKLIKHASANYQVEQRDIAMEEIQLAKEIFLTSTTKQILPVTHIDNASIGDGKPGDITKKLFYELKQLIGL